MALQRTGHSVAEWLTQQNCSVNWYQACLLLMELLAELHDVSASANNVYDAF